MSVRVHNQARQRGGEGAHDNVITVGEAHNIAAAHEALETGLVELVKDWHRLEQDLILLRSGTGGGESGVRRAVDSQEMWTRSGHARGVQRANA